MKIRFNPDADLRRLRGDLADMAAYPDVGCIILLGADGNGHGPDDLDPILQKVNVPIVGGIFPQVLYDGQHSEQGYVVLGLPQTAQVTVIPGLSDPEADYEALIEHSLLCEVEGETLFVFVDGLAQRIGSFVEALFNTFGLELNYLGGGAGSLDFQSKPVLFTGDGVVQDAAVLALTQQASGIGVHHGWESVSDGFRVTESRGNTILSLNWRPALDVYGEVLASQGVSLPSAEGFFDVAKRFPFGIPSIGGELVVRDPIAIGEDGGLICVGDVPEDVFVHVLSGTTSSLVDAAGQAVEQACVSLGGKPELTFVVDCISRNLFMGDDFQQEMDALRRTKLPTLGVLTLGEIANNGRKYLEFYNKTAVVGVFGEKS